MRCIGNIQDKYSHRILQRNHTFVLVNVSVSVNVYVYLYRALTIFQMEQKFTNAKLVDVNTVTILFSARAGCFFFFLPLVYFLPRMMLPVQQQRTHTRSHAQEKGREREEKRI